MNIKTPRDLGSMASHLRMFHAIWTGDIKHYREAATAHNADHAQPFGNGRIPHQHPDTVGAATPNPTNTEGTAS